MTTARFWKAMLLIAVFSVSLSSALHADADEAQLAILDRLPANIHLVESGGYWEAAESDGFFRVVVTAAGVEHVSHEMFIQWLELDPETQIYKLLRTVEVSEFGQAPVIFSRVDTAFGAVNAFRVGVAVIRRDESAREYSITVKGDGSYSAQAR